MFCDNPQHKKPERRVKRSGLFLQSVAFYKMAWSHFYHITHFAGSVTNGWTYNITFLSSVQQIYFAALIV